MLLILLFVAIVCASTQDNSTILYFSNDEIQYDALTLIAIPIIIIELIFLIVIFFKILSHKPKPTVGPMDKYVMRTRNID